MNEQRSAGRGWLWWPIGAAVLVAGLAWSGVLPREWIGGSAREAHSAPVAESRVRDPIVVTTAPVTVRSVQRRVKVVGTLEGQEEVEISPEVDGRIVKIACDVGDIVHPGDLLMEIDDTDFRLAVTEMERGLELELARLGVTDIPDETFDVSTLPTVMRARLVEEKAANVLARQKTLSRQNVTTQDALEEAETNHQVAAADSKQRRLEAAQILAAVRHRSAQLNTARKRLSDTRILVPHLTTLAEQSARPQTIQLVSASPPEMVTLTVAERWVSEGEVVRVNPSTKLFRLVVEDPLKLMASVPERHLGQLRVGQDVTLTVESYPNEEFRGQVKRINPTVDRQSRTSPIEIQIANADRRLKAGSFATAQIVIGEDASARTIPEESIVKFAGVVKVFRVDQDHVTAVPVQLGARLELGDGEQPRPWLEVTGDLAADSQVVVTGHAQLSDGTPVRIRE